MNRRAKIIIVLLLQAVLRYSGVQAVQETEPNDTLATATPTGLKPFGAVTILDATIGNGMHGPKDVDLFAFEILAGTPLPVLLNVRVNAADAKFDGLARLFDGTGGELANNDDPNGEQVDPEISTYLLEAGTFFIGISGSGNSLYDNSQGGSGFPGSIGAYSATLTLAPYAVPPSSIEPNDSTTESTFMGDGSFSIQGQFIGDGAYGRRDVDVYHTSIVSPSRVEVRVRAADAGSTLDAAVRLMACPFPSLGVQCDWVHADDAHDGSPDPNLIVTFTGTTALYLFVSGGPNVSNFELSGGKLPGEGEIGSVGPYDLEVEVTSLEGGGTNEPNDSILTAAPTYEFGLIGSVTVDGVIGDGPFATTRGDYDFYAVQVERSAEVLYAEVSPIGNDDFAPASPFAPAGRFAPIVAIYDFLGLRLATGQTIESLGLARAQAPITCRSGREPETDSATMYVLVMGTKQRFPDDPFNPHPTTRLIQKVNSRDRPGSAGAYRLSLRVRPQLCGDEPNDTLSTANDTGIVGEGSYVCSKGILEFAQPRCANGAQDVDLFRVDVTETPALLSITLADCPRLFDYRFCVLDSQGQALLGGIPFAGDPTYGLVPIQMTLPSPGSYYIAITRAICDAFDPNVDCSAPHSSPSEDELYDMTITLTPPQRPEGGNRSKPVTRAEATNRLFATRWDGRTNQIDSLIVEGNTATISESFLIPELRFSGSEGLAFDGAHLFYVGAGRYPTLYCFDLGDGVALDPYSLWLGSGFYSDATVLNGQLYLLDYLDRSIHVIDPVSARWLRTLPLGGAEGRTIGGGLAALSDPPRLYVADAFNTGEIFEVDPLDGVIVRTLAPSTVRPAALAADGDLGELFVADLRTSTAAVLSPSGAALGTLALPYPVGSMAGKGFAGAFPDCNVNGVADADEIDTGITPDCNANGRPDECDLTEAISQDCDANAVPDECEPDCDRDGVPDACEVDCNLNGLPDDCEPDCNRNGVADACDIAEETSLDSDFNGRPDECELVLFVDHDAPAGGDGMTWNSALADLQEALNIARTRGPAYGEIRVSAGTYRPAGPNGDRAASFHMVNGLSLLGGFAGTGEANPNDRNSGLYTTILSGDLNGDDGPDFENASENAYHVVIASGTGPNTVLDGFTVTGGFGNGESWSNRYGAGIFNDGGSPTIRDCTIVANRVHDTSILNSRGGGGMFNSRGNATIVRCTFRRNGLAMPTAVIAGALYNVDGTLSLTDCTFAENAAGPGALYNESGRCIIDRCRWIDNSGRFASAVYNRVGHVLASNSEFVGGRAGSNAASLTVIGGTLRVEHCTFVANTGGAVACLTTNPAEPAPPSDVSISNSILWNGPTEIRNSTGSTIRVDYTDLTGGWTGPGVGNLNVDPLFIDPLGTDGVAGTDDDDLRLQSTSPCIQSGDPAFESQPGVKDLGGGPRVLCGRTDMGAYEFGPGDYNCDRAVNLADFAAWAGCFTGPDLGPLVAGCEAFDFDADADVDLQDAQAMQNTFGGS